MTIERSRCFRILRRMKIVSANWIDKNSLSGGLYIQKRQLCVKEFWVQEKGKFFLNELTDTFGVQAVPPNRPLGLPPISLHPEAVPPPHPDILSSPPPSRSRKEILPIRILPEYFCTRNPPPHHMVQCSGAIESWLPRHNLSLDNSSVFVKSIQDVPYCCSK